LPRCLVARFGDDSAQFLSRVNCEFSLGNFEVDYIPIAVCYRTGVDVPDIGLAPPGLQA
jgi:hypothetical protein